MRCSYILSSLVCVGSDLIFTRHVCISRAVYRFRPVVNLSRRMPCMSNSLLNLPRRAPEVESFHDVQSSTFTYVVTDPNTRQCAIIDSVLDFDYPSGTVSTHSADTVIEFIRQRKYTLQWLIDTHVHADHLSAAPYIQSKLGGTLAIGAGIISVQNTFGKIFNEGALFRRDGSQFDHLFRPNERYMLGEIECAALHTPGHTPACMTHLIGDCAFVGDTLFMPDAGTARCDFPGGSADTLYDSIQKILTLPDDTKLYVCHDYQPDGRALQNVCTVKGTKAHNIHVGQSVSKAAFITLREARDLTLDMPALILPALQVNMRAGNMPEPEDNGMSYFKIPINVFRTQ